MTTTEYISILKARATKLQSGKALQIAAQTVHADRVERIFDKGSVTRGYSTKPIYISAKQNRKGVGKYFKGGYKEYKAYAGFDNSKVNFRNTNDLQSDFANSQVDAGTGTPDSGNVIKVSNSLFVEKLRSSENIDKLNENIKRFGNFVAFTNSEREKFNKILQLELTATLRGER